jgi:hypothetical protein
MPGVVEAVPGMLLVVLVVLVAVVLEEAMQVKVPEKAEQLIRVVGAVQVDMEALILIVLVVQVVPA